MSTTQVLATVTATVTETAAAVTATVTATASATPPPPIFAEAFWAFAAFEDMVLFCTGMLVAFILGDFTRLVAIPIIGPFCGAFANTLNWHGWQFPGYSITQRRVMIVISECFYSTQNLVLPLYSYVLLNKILSGNERRIYLTVYLPIYVGLWLLQAPQIYFAQHFLDEDTAANGVIVDRLSVVNQVAVVFIELWSAYFLIKSFYTARRNTKVLGAGGRTGLFTALLQSSEIRVASLCTCAILRLSTYRSYDNGGPALETVAHLAFAMQETFPVVLQIDLVASKLLKLTNAARAARPNGGPRPQGNIEKVSNETCGSAESGKGALDSVSREFGQYGVGSDWSAKGSTMVSMRPTRSVDVPGKVPENGVYAV